MDKLYTGNISHAFTDKKIYSILLPKGDYLVFRLNESTMILKEGDGIEYYYKTGGQTMRHINSGEVISVTVEYIGASLSDVISYRRLG